MADTETTQQQSPTPTTIATVPTGSGKEQGVSGTLIYSGIITDEEYNRMLMGKRGLKKFEEMRKSDSGVQQTLKVCKYPILSVKYSIQEASDQEGDKYAQRFIERELGVGNSSGRNVNWHRVNRDALGCLDFGFAVMEKVLELTEFEGKTRIGIKKLASRKQTSIDKWETKDGKPGITQQGKDNSGDDPANQFSVPMEKLVIFTNEMEGENWQGVSLLRYAFKDYDIRNKLIVANAVSLEKLGGGVPVLRAPAQADKKDMEKARAALRAMRVNQEAYVELPQGWELDMLDMKSNSVKDMLPTIQYHETMMKKSILASFLDLGTNSSGGSRAVSQDHSQLFEKSLEAVAQMIVDVVNEQIIKPLCDLNFSEMPNGYPKLVFGNIGDEDLQVMGDFLNKLASVDLVTPDPDLEDYLRSLGRMPKLPDDIRKNYDNRQLNKNAIEHTTLAPVQPTRAGDQPQPNGPQPGTTTTTTPKGTDNLPTDPKNPTKKAEAAVEATRAAKKQLIDVILG